jgi:hypothetical protein
MKELQEHLGQHPRFIKEQTHHQLLLVHMVQV